MLRTQFTPRHIANLGAWWDCSDSARYTLLSGVVSSFTDTTGTYTLTQSTAANRPSVSAINGRPAFAFNGRSTALFNNSAVASPWGTYLWVAQSAVSDANGRAIMGSGTATPAVATATFGLGSISAGVWNAGNRIGGTQVGVNGFGTIVNVPYVGSSVIPNSSSITLRINRATGSLSSGGGSGNSSGISLGSRLSNGNPSAFWGGVIGEVLWYTRTLSSDEILAVETYLANRWRIA